MTAQVFQIRDYQQRKDIERLYSDFANQVAIEIANVALISSEPLGKDFEEVLYSNLFSLYLTDTSPCEMSQDSGDCA